MKRIDLAKLKEMAIAVASAEQGSREWDKATDELNDNFPPESLVELITQLQVLKGELQP